MQTEVDATGWDDIVLVPSLLADIRATIDAFFGQKEIFHRFGFAWRRGLLLVGPPGTGKTMICKAAARSHTEVPFLSVRDLSTVHGRGDALSRVFDHARRLAPCILAIEDMDDLVDRANRTTFLNELDGFKNNDGLLIIASSNHPDRIDEALLKRPSRFDRVYHVGLPELRERTEYCRRLLGRSPMPMIDMNVETLACQIAAATEGFTPAFLKEAILSAALAAAQEGRTELTAEFADRVLGQVEVLKKYLKKARNPETFAEMLPATGNEIGFRSR
jgi:SpoVK/Ycf46/Vps4 family AAA+-type ATPase